MISFKHYLIMESNAAPFLRFYKAIGTGDWRRSGHVPDDATLWECLTILENYYSKYINWYTKVKPKLRTHEDIVIDNYRRRLFQIKNALESNDVNEKIKAIDDAINQWHIDCAVIHHLKFAADDLAKEQGKKLTSAQEKEWTELSDILFSLGKMPEEAPYAETEEEQEKRWQEKRKGNK